jgi:hypothetical protein
MPDFRPSVSRGADPRRGRTGTGIEPETRPGTTRNSPGSAEFSEQREKTGVSFKRWPHKMLRIKNWPFVNLALMIFGTQRILNMWDRAPISLCDSLSIAPRAARPPGNPPQKLQ